MNFFADQLFSDPVFYLTAVFVIVGSIVLHELGHALAATWEGDLTPRARGHLTWNPVVHMGWFSLAMVFLMGIGWGQTPVNRSAFRHRRWGDVLVSFAGPGVNLFLALVGAFVFALMQRGGVPGDSWAWELWFLMVRLNVLLFLLNMLPAPPLDGFAVADGAFDLGDFGAMMRRAGFIPLIVALLVVNSGPFRALADIIVKAILTVAGVVVGL